MTPKFVLFQPQCMWYIKRAKHLIYSTCRTKARGIWKSGGYDCFNHVLQCITFVQKIPVCRCQYNTRSFFELT